MKFAKVLLAGSAFAMSGLAFAATDGTLGQTSTGTSVVTVIKDNAVQISKVDDINLGTHASLAADAVGSDDVCVFNSTGSYQVTVSSANTYNLSGTGGDIPYTVTWSDGNAVLPATGAAIPAQSGDNTDPNCGGGTNATFEVTVSAALFNSAAPGSYTDTLTLLVEPM